MEDEEEEEYPTARVLSMDQEGRILFEFSEPMQIPDLSKLSSGNITMSNGEKVPIFELSTIPDIYQDQSKLDFAWSVKDMSARLLVL